MNMREIITILLFLISLTIFATEQTPDSLIYKSDTLFIDSYPLEYLMEKDSLIKKSILSYSEDMCMSTDCWRGHIATWKIENDSLFLISLENGCGDYEFNLDKVFGRKNVKKQKIFANWFTGYINADFGVYLAYDVEKMKDTYSKSFNCKVVNGKIEYLVVTKKTDCEIASILAQKDFEESNYSFHSLAFFPTENAYLHVLGKYFNIGWCFTDSMDYYNCYDSVMIDNLKVKYGSDFLDRAKSLADSLEQTENWISNAEYKGGQEKMLKYIMTRLTIDTADINKDVIKTKLYVELEIDSTGKVINPRIRRGINEIIDRKVLNIIRTMPDWKPAYLYGKPIWQSYTFPIKIDCQ